MGHKMVIGNWKMHGTQHWAHLLTKALLTGLAPLAGVEVVVCPSYLHMQAVASQLQGSLIKLGGQNCYPGHEAAITGEISAIMLRDMGCQFVLLGHSERRQLFDENAQLLANKLEAAYHAGLAPILCVGENSEQKASGQTEEVLRSQLRLLKGLRGDRLAGCLIAYEPVWAIGSGVSASVDEVVASHTFIRQELSSGPRIFYGGSVKPDNVAALLQAPEVDGVLVGNAALNAESFIEICNIANRLA